MIGINFALIVILIIATAFFVAAEFAFVRVRSSRIDQLVLEGNKTAISVQRILSNMDGYLSACQLGITITALGLGWLGEPTVEKLLHSIFEPLQLHPNLEKSISFIIAFASITFLHVVLGELAPKTVAIQKAERISLILARPMIIFYKVLYPFIWSLNGAANSFVRLFGLKPAKEHEEALSEEELRLILTESYQSGEINQTEYGYVSRIFEFDELKAREIMVPRTDMACLYIDKSLEENLKIIKGEQFTRFPVANQNKDTIIGMINTKQFFLQYADNPNIHLPDLLHPVLTVAESIPIKTLLKEMQKQRVHISILLDEYGGTAGMVTLEDILEEIVGEIRDEFDKEEIADIEFINEKHANVDGKVLISEINNIFNSELDQDEFDTIGGWLYGHNPTMKEGERWVYQDLTFILKKRDAHRYRKIEIKYSQNS